MPEATSSHEEHGNKQTDHGDEGVIATKRNLREGLAEAIVESDLPEMPDQELEPSVGGELLVPELDADIAVDTAGQSALISSHPEWALLSGSRVVAHFPKSRKRAHFQLLPSVSTAEDCRIRVSTIGGPHDGRQRLGTLPDRQRRDPSRVLWKMKMA